MAKEHRYQVETTTDIVGDMARYDEAITECGEFVRLGSIHPITDETTAKALCRDGEECNSRLIYRWTLTSKYPPTVDRWASFGIRVEEVK